MVGNLASQEVRLERQCYKSADSVRGIPASVSDNTTLLQPCGDSHRLTKTAENPVIAARALAVCSCSGDSRRNAGAYDEPVRSKNHADGQTGCGASRLGPFPADVATSTFFVAPKSSPEGWPSFVQFSVVARSKNLIRFNEARTPINVARVSPFCSP